MEEAVAVVMQAEVVVIRSVVVVLGVEVASLVHMQTVFVWVDAMQHDVQQEMGFEVVELDQELKL